MGEKISARWAHLSSAQDASQNFVLELGAGSAFEARYVRRTDDYFICYLSPLAGCAQLCRMCHLTVTGQLSTQEASIDELEEQARVVLAHYDSEAAARPASHVNFNLMARGDALSSSVIASRWDTLRERLLVLASKRNLSASFNISTIFPTEAASLDVAKIFSAPDVVFYYSLYSLRPEFRRRWLPRAQDPMVAFERLKEWQDRGGQELCLHWALIAGENDSIEEAREIGEAVTALGLRAKFNLVRYNPADAKRGAEAPVDRLEAYFETLAGILASPRSRIVPRVGLDVKASCGMFVEA